MARAVVCLTTVGSRRDAMRLARELVRKKLAACVNVISGAVSFYHWKGKLCRDPEILLVIKTTSAKVSALERELTRLHPYDLPEFVVLPVTRGSRRYLSWLARSVRAVRG